MTRDIDFTVRKLSDADSDYDRNVEDIKVLCSDRSYMGKDIGDVFSYRELWGSLVIDPYLELSPEFIWVAQDKEESKLLGYLTGAVREDFYQLQEHFVDRLIEKLGTEGLLNLLGNPMQMWTNALNILSGLDRRTIEFLKYLKFRAKDEIPKRPLTPHFNVFARHDGQGIARALIGAFREELKRLDMARFHITALYVPGERMQHELEKEGFRVRPLEFFLNEYTIYDAVETTIFDPYDVMIGCFESEVEDSSRQIAATHCQVGNAS